MPQAQATEGIAPPATASSGKKSLLRFITCGSVDDGKSTLIGRVLYETLSVPDDQLDALERDSKKFGTQGDRRDYALLVDGLSAEREQGITIDVAYRYFSTTKRAFIVADTPGHEQYTRNMATGASNAELAIILVDARKGILSQTRRHSLIVSMVGVRHIIVAVNKMDLVAYSKASFEAIERDYRMLAKSLGLSDVTIIPVSAVEGDNIADRSVHMPWYKGPTLISHLETVEISSRAEDHGFSFPVQWVNRPDSQFRGYSGQIASGIVHQGDTIRLVPHGGEARIDRIVTFDGDLEQAEKGQSVTLVLDRELDISRGDVIVSPEARIASAKSVVARIIWMSVEPLDAEKSYLFKLGTTTVAGTLIIPKSALDIETYQEMPLETVGINTIFDTRIGFDRTVATAIYQDNRDLGAFLVIDRVSNEVVALGLVSDAGRADQQKITKVSNHHHAQPWQFNAPRIKIIAFTLATFAIAFLVAAVASAFKIDMVAALVSFAFAEIILHAVIDHFFPTLLLRDPSMLKPGEGI